MAAAEQLPSPRAARARSIPTPRARYTHSTPKGRRGGGMGFFGEREEKQRDGAECDTESPSGRGAAQHPVARGFGRYAREGASERWRTGARKFELNFRTWAGKRERVGREIGMKGLRVSWVLIYIRDFGAELAFRSMQR